MENGWLKVHLNSISNQLTIMDGKLDVFIQETCPEKHKAVDDRIVELERTESNRKAIAKVLFALAGFIGGAAVWLGDKLWQLIK